MEHCTLVLTTQCTLACRYCALCRENGPAATPDQVLNTCREAAAAGVRRFNLAGGDPLLLDDLPDIIRQIKALPGVEWVSLTTNGTRLYPQLADLKQAGLDGINLHLDACDAFTFTGITGKSQLLNEILKGPGRRWHRIFRSPFPPFCWRTMLPIWGCWQAWPNPTI